MKKLLIIVLIVIVAGLLWVALNKNNNSIEAVVYQNTNLGFAATFPESMRGYTVTERVDTEFHVGTIELKFKIPGDNDPVGTISAVPLAKWATGWPCLEGQEPCALAKEVARNSNFVFAVSGYGTYGGPCGPEGNKDKESSYCTAQADLLSLSRDNFSFAQ